MRRNTDIYEKQLKEIDRRLNDKKHMSSIRLAIGNKLTLVKRTLSGFPANKKDLQDRYRDLKDHAVDNIDHYLTQAKSNLEANGCTVYLAEDAEDAVTFVLGLLSECATVIKSKSNVVYLMHLQKGRRSTYLRQILVTGLTRC
jgi:L-lactate utilization protein LutB